MKNQGYRIIDLIPVSITKDGQESGFVIGHNPAAPSPWVTWRYTKKKGVPSSISYYSGNYWVEERNARCDFYRRISDSYAD